MGRPKKTEKKEEPVIIAPKKPDYGSGWNKINNMLQAGFSLQDIREEEGNE